MVADILRGVSCSFDGAKTAESGTKEKAHEFDAHGPLES
jgi:hypothetical protein